MAKRIKELETLFVWMNNITPLGLAALALLAITAISLAAIWALAH